MQVDAKELRRVMAAKGFTIAALAREAGITTVTINNLLNHSNKARIDTVGRLAKALECDIYAIAKD